MITRSLVFYNDPGHGWLKVKKGDLVKLGIQDKITPYSYQRGDWAYLEEDCDAHRFLQAAKLAGWQVKTTDRHTNRSSKVRSYESYAP